MSSCIHFPIGLQVARRSKTNGSIRPCGRAGRIGILDGQCRVSISSVDDLGRGYAGKCGWALQWVAAAFCRGRMLNPASVAVVGVGWMRGSKSPRRREGEGCDGAAFLLVGGHGKCHDCGHSTGSKGALALPLAVRSRRCDGDCAVVGWKPLGLEATPTANRPAIWLWGWIYHDMHGVERNVMRRCASGPSLSVTVSSLPGRHAGESAPWAR